MNIFSMDNPFFRFVGRLTDLVWINILTLICCIPVFTAGAALSAMYSVLIKMALKEEGTVTKPYFKAFKENFKKATPIWLIFLAIAAILGMNISLIRQGIMEGYGKLFVPVNVSIGIIGAIAFGFINYYFALISRYDADLKQSVKNALLMMVAYLPRTLCMIVIWASPIALMTLSDYFFFLWFLYGFSFPGYINAMLFGSIFLKTEKIKEN